MIMSETTPPKHLLSAYKVEVLRVTTLEGTGVPEDPHRHIVSYFDMEGTCLAINDPYEPTNPTTHE